MALLAGGGRASTRSQESPTPQQEAFYGALRDADSHLVLEARAGTGKSTSCAEGMHRVSRRADLLYCAFNKHIAGEFGPRAPGNCRAATMHSFGFRMLKDAVGKVTLSDDKTEELAERYFPARWDDRPARSAAAKLVSLCKNLLEDGTDPARLRQLAADYDVALDRQAEDVIAIVPELLAESRELTATIDFDDMIWLPVVLGLEASRPADFAFLDEAQDTNPCQVALLDRLCPSGRKVVVGDPHQAIYAFRGADSDAMGNIGGDLAGTARGLARYPLTVTWRCPRSHVHLANGIVPDLEAAPGAEEGEVLELPEPQALARLEAGEMVLCRTNAPLISACYRLIRSGRKAVVRGRDIGKGLLTLLARMRAKDVQHLVGRLDDYRVSEARKLSELRNPTPALMALNDRVGCLLALCDGLSAIDDVKARIGRLFSDDDERGAVVFSSIHKAKGLERDSITILCPELLPHPAADSAVGLTQEHNLAYVAATRSRHRLVFAGSIPLIYDNDDSRPLIFPGA